MTGQIALATCDHFPGGNDDDRVLLRALAERGLPARAVSWSEPLDWSEFAATVIRSTWDYTSRRAEFLAWVETVPRLHNPADVVRANSDKRYLAGLAEAGIPIVPTRFIAPGQELVLPERGEFVLKPSIGSGTRGAGRFRAEDADDLAAAHAHAHGLTALGTTVLVQPYLAEVETSGETALIFFDGRFSHAVEKAARLAPGARHGVAWGDVHAPDDLEPRPASTAQLDVAERALAVLSRGLDTPLLYARIDLLPTPDGPVVIEAELTEPCLYLASDEAAAGRLAAAVADRIAAT